MISAFRRQQTGARQVFVAISPGEKIADFRTLFPGDYLSLPQIHALDLGERIQSAARQIFALSGAKLLIIGTDSPNPPLAYLEIADQALDSHDIVIGPVDDGGYYLIGLKKLHAKLFEDIAWSTSEVFAQTLERCRDLNLHPHLLPSWYDVDDLPSYERLLRDSPGFAEFSN